MVLKELFHCPNCNAALDLGSNSAALVRCDYCHSMVIVPESLREKTVPADEEEVISPKPPKPIKPTLSEEEAVAKVTELAQMGEKIEAMQLYRETFPVGLMEAKTAIEQVESGSSLLIPAVSQEDEASLPIAAAEKVTQLITAGKMDEAARLYRITFDTSHVEAETAVAQLLEGKSINVARRTAKREAQATAVRRIPEGREASGLPRSLWSIAIFFLLLFLVVAAVLALVLVVL